MIFASLTKKELLDLTKGFKAVSKHTDKTTAGIANHMKFTTTIRYAPPPSLLPSVELNVIVTNMDIEISRSIDMSLPAASTSGIDSTNPELIFECLIPMTVIDFAKSLKDDTDVIELTSLSGDWKSFTVSSGVSLAKFNGVDPIYFPKKKSNLLTKTLDILPNSLYNLLRGVSHVPVPQEKATKAFCSGINIKGLNGKIICTATDSYRVAETTMVSPNIPNFELTIPYETALILSEIIKNESSIISISNDAGMVSFVTPDTQFIASLLATTFPDCQKFMSINGKYYLEFNNQEFIANLKQMRIFSKEEKCTMHVMPNELRLEIRDEVVPLVASEVHNAVLTEANGVSQDSFTTSFMTSFILAHLERLDPDNSPYWTFQDVQTPSIITGEMDDDISSRYLVVPMKE